MVAYWHKDGVEVYRIGNKKTEKIASGSLDKFSSVKYGLGKKILIVSRGLLLHARKRYPPASEEKLFKAVALEIGDIFPISQPAIYCRIFQTADTHAVVDIWGWEKSLYARIKAIFPFHYVVPEDLLFSSEIAEAKIFQNRGMTNILAHAGGKFLAGASYPDSGFNQDAVERFLHSIEQYGVEIKNIRIYGNLPFILNYAAEVFNVKNGGYPPCLDELAGFDLSGFKVREGRRFLGKADLLLRVCIYLVAGFAVMQYLTLTRYDQAADDIRKKMAIMDGKVSGPVDGGKAAEDYSEILQEINEKERATTYPLKVMNMLARRLPEGSFLNRLVLNENKVELSVSSNDPLAVVKVLADEKEISKVSLKGALLKEQRSDRYKFIVTFEF